MITVKVSGVPASTERWGNLPRQSFGGKGIWNNYRFVSGDTRECDYWVVYDQIPKTERCRCPPKNTIFITGEPEELGAYPTKFLNQFGNIITSHSDIAGRTTANVFRMQECHPWIVNKSYDELVSMPCSSAKPKLISLVTTRKYKKRYHAALKLKEHFRERLDLFGEGINPISNKWDALYPYQYSIAMENSRADDYFTEKLTDCYLAQAYPFYYGAPNIGDYFPHKSYTVIDIDNIPQTIDTIERVIEAGTNRSDINTARELCLNKYNFFPTIIRLIEKNPECFGGPATEVEISDKDRFLKDKMLFLKKIARDIRDGV